MMNRLFRGILTAVFTLALSGTVCAASLDDLLGAERAAVLRSAGLITDVQLKNPELRLLPRHEELRRLVSETMGSLGPGILVETLFRYAKPAAQPAANGWTEAERAGLFNQVLALSSLTGIQYYSASRGTMRTFYESSAVIDGPNTKRAVLDPVYAMPPASLTLYARQKDLTFGDNIYRYDYWSTADAFFFVQENLTALTAGIIPAVGKNKLRTTFAVIDCGDSLLIYAASMAKAVSLPGMGERIGNSFSNRAEAVLKWFTGKADAVLGGGAR
jgi:hypothetical protein